MRLDRLLLAATACALVAVPAGAQTSTSGTRGVTPPTGSGAMSAQSDMNTTGMNTTGMNSTGSTPQSPTTGATTGMSSSGAMQAGASNTTGASASSFQPITPAAGADLVAVLQSSGQFTTLLKAITATNLTSVLQRPGALTIFAPTDAAFAALPPGALASLMTPANLSKLQQLVLLHAVNTPITSKDLLNHTATNVATVATDKKVHLDGSSGAIKVDDAKVLQSDVKASNGTIFVIDKVLSPDYTAPAATASAAR